MKIIGSYIRAESGRMIYIDDVKEIARVLILPYNIFDDLRDDLIDDHGYGYYRDAFEIATKALFSSLPEYNNILKKD